MKVLQKFSVRKYGIVTCVLLCLGAIIGGHTYVTAQGTTPSPPKAQSLIQDGNFQQFEPWTFINRGDASSFASLIKTNQGNAMRLVVHVNTPYASWNAQLRQSFRLVGGQPVTISYQARSWNGNEVNLVLQDANGPDYTEYFNKTEFVEGSSWNTYTYTFTPQIDNPTTLIAFNMASETGTIWLANVQVVTGSLTPTTPVAGATATLPPIAQPTAAPTPTPETQPTATPTPAPTTTGLPPAIDSSWKMSFDDEFSDSDVNWGTWQNGGQNWGSGGNGEQQEYLAGECSEANGTLQLQAENKSANGKRYSSCMVNTLGTFQQTYGYFEFRGKIPQGQGLWPAFWLYNSALSGAPEIDVMENLGNNTSTYYATYHSNSGQQQQTYNGVNLANGYHTYGVKWTPDAITFYLDNVAVRTVTSNIYQGPMFLLINLAVGGNWPGSPNASTSFPSTFNVDYVRVYAMP